MSPYRYTEKEEEKVSKVDAFFNWLEYAFKSVGRVFTPAVCFVSLLTMVGCCAVDSCYGISLIENERQRYDRDHLTHWEETNIEVQRVLDVRAAELNVREANLQNKITTFELIINLSPGLTKEDRENQMKILKQTNLK